MATLREAISAIQAHAITAGAQEAPTDPTESNVKFPFSVCYPSTGTIGGEAQAQRRDLVNLFLDYHVARQLLPQDVQTALTFYEAFPDLLINDPTLGGNVSALNMGRDNGISFQFGQMEYAGIDTIGFRFTIPVKVRSATA